MYLFKGPTPELKQLKVENKLILTPLFIESVNEDANSFKRLRSGYT
jgi:hypothetical protein